MRKLTCIFQCCLWPSSYYCSWTRAGSGRSASCASSLASFTAASGLLLLQLTFVFHSRPVRPQRALRLDRADSGNLRQGQGALHLSLPPTHPQPSPNCEEPRRALALGPTPPEVPFRARDGLPAKLAPSPPCRNEACPKVIGSQGKKRRV